ncbi:MAG: tryptophan 7-halogenase, partial [Asticcacaulis sp.]|nr:tryptophan 7-halogenase [Asticcacaulis sp.]
MSDQDRITKVVIVGRDEAVWLSANIVQRALGKTGLDITVVELPSLLRPGDIIPTLKQLEAYHSLLGIDEAALMRTCDATFTLGQRFSNWSKTRPPFIHGYSTYGRPLNQVNFHHYWVKARAQGMQAEFEDFSINAAAAKRGFFFLPGPETDGFAICDYAYHLNAQAYCHVLKAIAGQRGIRTVAARVAEVHRDPDDGRIAALKLMNGETVEGDFFIDASGAESVLLGGALGVGFESWQKWFPCDRLLTTYAPPLSPLPSFSQLSAFRSGWVGQYPLRSCTAIQQVYTSVDMTDNEAFEAAGIVTSMRLHADAVVTPLAVGARTVYWAKNCVAIGEAAAVLDPVDSVRLHLSLIGLSHLISLFPISRNCDIESAEYNKNAMRAVERVRDYQLCHYLLNQRFDQPLWDHCRSMQPPEMLRYKLELFAARGNVVIYDDETFEEDDWLSMLFGHGLMPRAYDPVADQTS